MTPDPFSGGLRACRRPWTSTALAGIVLLTLCATSAAGWSLQDTPPSLQCAGAVLAAAPAEQPAPPQPLQAPGEPDGRSARDLEGGWDRANYGVGFLRPDKAGQPVGMWAEELVTPIYATAGGEHLGWLNRGWVEQAGGREPLARAGMIETDYELLTFVLYAARDDGWLQIRLRPPGLGSDGGFDDGRVWVHTCRLTGGGIRLVPTLWRDFFLAADLPFVFRQQVRHALRAAPTTESERLLWLTGDDEVEPLEIQGDWMRVAAFVPGKYEVLCSSGEPWDGRRLEGWIRWRDDRKGPWLYWPTRGC